LAERREYAIMGTIENDHARLHARELRGIFQVYDQKIEQR
jgi:hypothetical protein